MAIVKMHNCPFKSDERRPIEKSIENHLKIYFLLARKRLLQGYGRSNSKHHFSRKASFSYELSFIVIDD